MVQLTALVHVEIRIGGAVVVALQIDGQHVQDPVKVGVAPLEDGVVPLALVRRVEQLVLAA